MLENNGYQGQLAALNEETKIFQKDKDLFSIIRINSKFTEPTYLKRIGILAQPGDVIKFGNIITGGSLQEEEIQIGKTGIYEVDNVKIKSLSFKENSGPDAIIDYILIQGE